MLMKNIQKLKLMKIRGDFKGFVKDFKRFFMLGDPLSNCSLFAWMSRFGTIFTIDL